MYENREYVKTKLVDISGILSNQCSRYQELTI